jgi:hypothetical protein
VVSRPLLARVAAKGFIGIGATDGGLTGDHQVVKGLVSFSGHPEHAEGHAVADPMALGRQDVVPGRTIAWEGSLRGQYEDESVRHGESG